LGKLYTDPVAVDYRATYDNTMIEDPVRKTCAFKDGDNVYAVEELAAIILAHARQQCEIFAGEPIRDVVLTVRFYLV
jgi:molecular chaperone DnaK (HSP70)